MKRFIFLDVDGVLHPLNERHVPALVDSEDLYKRVIEEEENDSDHTYVKRVLDGEFVPEIMRNIKTAIIDKIGDVSIILSSTWRETLPSRKAVDKELEKYGIPAVSGYTPQCNACYHFRRANEIVLWLQQYVEQEQSSITTPFRFVVLDDADLLETDSNAVHSQSLNATAATAATAASSATAADVIAPSFVRCDKLSGLTADDCARAVAILNENNCASPSILNVRVSV